MIIIIVEDHHITTTIMNYKHDDHHLGCAARRGRCALRGVNEKLRNLEDDACDWIDVPRESRAGGGGPGGAQEDRHTAGLQGAALLGPGT